MQACSVLVVIMKRLCRPHCRLGYFALRVRNSSSKAFKELSSCSLACECWLKTISICDIETAFFVGRCQAIAVSETDDCSKSLSSTSQSTFRRKLCLSWQDVKPVTIACYAILPPQKYVFLWFARTELFWLQLVQSTEPWIRNYVAFNPLQWRQIGCNLFYLRFYM